MFHLKVNDGGLTKFSEALRKDFEGGGNGPIAQAFQEWGREYANYIYSRFYTGGGDRPWASLSGKTITRKGHGIILVDTGTLQEAFAFGSQILRIERTARNEITVSLSGGRHPKSRLSVESLADLHHEGTATIPSRPIWVRPPASFETRMKQIMTDAINRLKRETGAD